jgi:hypothetical protein
MPTIDTTASPGTYAKSTPVSRHWADHVPRDRAPSIPGDDPWGCEIDRPDATWLTIVEDPRGLNRLIRPRRDYNIDPIYGTEGYVRRHCYFIGTVPKHEEIDPERDIVLSDATSLDDEGGRILIGDQRGDSKIGGGATNRLPDPALEGQHLRLNRLGVGNTAIPGGPTRFEADPDGLTGGTQPAENPGDKVWRIEIRRCGELSILEVHARTEKDARRQAKAALGIAKGEPLPPGTRVRVVA